MLFYIKESERCLQLSLLHYHIDKSESLHISHQMLLEQNGTVSLIKFWLLFGMKWVNWLISHLCLLWRKIIYTKCLFSWLLHHFLSKKWICPNKVFWKSFSETFFFLIFKMTLQTTKMLLVGHLWQNTNWRHIIYCFGE